MLIVLAGRGARRSSKPHELSFQTCVKRRGTRDLEPRFFSTCSTGRRQSGVPNRSLRCASFRVWNDGACGVLLKQERVFSLGVFAGGVPEGGGGVSHAKTGGSEPGANTPSRLRRTPPPPRGRGRKCCNLSPSATSPGEYPKGEGVFQRVQQSEKGNVPINFPLLPEASPYFRRTDEVPRKWKRPLTSQKREAKRPREKREAFSLPQLLVYHFVSVLLSWLSIYEAIQRI